LKDSLKRRIAMLAKNLARPASLLLALVVATLTLAVVGHATQTVIVPNSTTIVYNLAAGASSAPVTPPSNQPVLILGSQLAVGFRGVSQCVLLHIPASFLEWVGLESTAGAAITQGFSGTAGTHILFLDFSHQVDIRVNSTDTFVIRNGSTSPRNGIVRMIW
jgi:hypothetical protein